MRDFERAVGRRFPLEARIDGPSSIRKRCARSTGSKSGARSSTWSSTASLRCCSDAALDGHYCVAPACSIRSRSDPKLRVLYRGAAPRKHTLEDVSIPDPLATDPVASSFSIHPCDWSERSDGAGYASLYLNPPGLMSRTYSGDWTICPRHLISEVRFDCRIRANWLYQVYDLRAVHDTEVARIKRERTCVTNQDRIATSALPRGSPV